MDNGAEILEIVNFIKDRMVTKDEHKADLAELRAEMNDLFDSVNDRIDAVISRLSAVDNRMDTEAARRMDLEQRVRSVVPTLPLAPERI